MTKMIGKIATWNLERGFGFIKCDDGGADVFVHCSDLSDLSRDHLPVGTRVSFDIAPPDRSGKQRAINVSILGNDSADRRPAPREAAQALFRPAAAGSAVAGNATSKTKGFDAISYDNDFLILGS
jgi:CspA family cold shock protein